MALRGAKRVRRLLSLITVVVAVSAGVAQGELTREGNLVVSLKGDILPHALPRDTLAPVRVRVEGSVRTLNGARPPELRRLAIALNSQGRLFSRGLPRCTAGQLQQTSTEVALEICGPALVGRGRFEASVDFPSLAPFPAEGALLAFNARRRGRQAILIHIYGTSPTPLTFILPLTINQDDDGTFGTLLSARLPSIASELGYVTNVSLTIGRRYRHEGRARSFLSASCAAPEGFPGAIFPFAKGTFSFSNGQTLTTSLVRDCRVRR
jgi:hypothetical protein